MGWGFAVKGNENRRNPGYRGENTRELRKRPDQFNCPTLLPGHAAHASRLAASALGAYFRQLLARLKKRKAATASTHNFAKSIYTMLTTGLENTDKGQKY